MKNNPSYFMYTVKSGENLGSIAKKFDLSPQDVIRANQLRSPFIYIGQPLLIPNHNLVEEEVEERALSYKPVTAYTATSPILVNGVDINNGLYPVLNFKPDNATYPYIYVPIAEFSRVGAKVVWDDASQTLTVTSDYDQLKSQVTALTSENQTLTSMIEDLSKNELGNTTGNLINTGFVAQDSDWLYYWKRRNTLLYGALSKEKTDLTSDTDLVADDGPLYINVLDGWVYFRNDRYNGKIYKVQTDGSQETKITDDSSTDIVVRGDWIYYANQTDGGKLYKIKTDGTSKTKLNDDSTSAINLIGDTIYYQNVTDSNKPYKIQMDGTQRTKVSDLTTYQLLVYGDWLYFRNPADGNKLYKMTINGTSLMKINDVATSVFNISNGWIYYATVTVPGGDLYKIQIDGTNNTALNVQFVTDINLFDDWIYYLTIEKMVYRIKTDGTQQQNLYQ